MTMNETGSIFGKIGKFCIKASLKIAGEKLNELLDYYF